MEPAFRLTVGKKARLVAHYLRRCWPHFVLALLLACLGMAFNALTPQIIGQTVDVVLGTQEPRLPAWLLNVLHWDALRTAPARALSIAAVGVLLTALLNGLCTFGRRTQLSRGSESFVKAIRDDLFRHIQYLSFAWQKNNPTGDIIQRCTSDVDVIRNFVCNQLIDVVRTVFLLILYLTIMLRMNPRLSIVPLISIPVVGLSSGIFYRKISSRFQAADEAEGELTTCTQENLTGVRVVRAFGRERFEEGKFKEKNEHYSALWIRLGKVLSVYWASGTLLTSLQIMAMILVGVIEAVSGRITLGTFLIFISYNEALSWPVRSLGRVLSEMSKAGVSMDRVGYILAAEEEIDEPDAQDFPGGDIIFEHVTFAYEGQNVLEDLSFTIHEGETFAILGGTGAGKSTLVHLLDRLYDLPDNCGRITVGGIDIRRIARRALRSRIGLVLQEPFLFSQTVEENIRAARDDAERADVRRCASIACVDDAIDSFANGYETLVGERGVTLSGGQKQRVAIARMLMQDAPVMIFDDSLSAVDAETDARIRAALQRELGGATVILISHRITTLMQADRILVLEHGRAADIGTHTELISRPGLYRDIYEIQLSADDRAMLQEGGEEHAGI